MFLVILQALVTPEMALKQANSKLSLREIKNNLQAYTLSRLKRYSQSLFIICRSHVQLLDKWRHCTPTQQNKVLFLHLTQRLYFTGSNQVSNHEARKIHHPTHLWPSESCLHFSTMSHQQSEAPAVSSHIAASWNSPYPHTPSSRLVQRKSKHMK